MKTNQNFLTSLVLVGLLSLTAAHTAAHADQMGNQQPTRYDQDPNGQYVTPPQPTQQEQQSMAKESTDYKETSIRDEVLGFAPQVGSLSYTNPNGAYSARAVAGITGSFNITPLVASPGNRDWYVGITTGTLYSHNGSSSSNFFGSNSDIVATDNSNILIIPADLKVGYNMGENFRLSAHGGGNLIYRSSANSVNFGAGSSSNDSLWRLFPNVGADMEWQVSKRVSILLRPDMTLTPGNDALTATLGATFVAL